MRKNLHIPALSIHDLTRRSTSGGLLQEEKQTSFNSRPHKEVDISTEHGDILLLSFNSRPHKEVDDMDVIIENHKETFNSRPHKEVDPDA